MKINISQKSIGNQYFFRKRSDIKIAMARFQNYTKIFLAMLQVQSSMSIQISGSVDTYYTFRVIKTL